MRIYKENAPDRFPKGHLPSFEEYLDKDPLSFFVAQTPDNEIIACGGVTDIGLKFHILCYGMVDPAFQNCRVGSTMVLARMAFATRYSGDHTSIIYSVPRSIGFFERFGYKEVNKWTDEEGHSYPIAANRYSREIFDPIKRILDKRGHLITPDLPIVMKYEVYDMLTKSDSSKVNPPEKV
ncbi:MAG: GNAT family N-acetyltransferase [Deltaproteobacteria bacterium]|nr:GNAT family N-acetyltransferase [Deltaproteobacteria bacterium]